ELNSSTSMTITQPLNLQGVGASELIAGGASTPVTLGALRIASGSHTWSGLVTQANNVTMIATSGTSINFSGGYAMANKTLTVSGLGTANFSSAISTSSGT